MGDKQMLQVYKKLSRGFYRGVARWRVVQFLKRLMGSKVPGDGLEAAYRAMAREERRENAAREWSEGLI
ncbi:MAG: hypothetical protein KJO98_14210 [Rhodothermia bacterium]|nr:hypothetical protein [Rhodothermia bacterium]